MPKPTPEERERQEREAKELLEAYRKNPPGGLFGGWTGFYSRLNRPPPGEDDDEAERRARALDEKVQQAMGYIIGGLMLGALIAFALGIF